MWVLKANLALFVINVLVLPILSLLLKSSVSDLLKSGFFSMILLLDAGIIFLVSGFTPLFSSIFFSKVREHVFHSDEEWSQEKHRKSLVKANVYIILGALLLVESLVAGFIIW